MNLYFVVGCKRNEVKRVPHVQHAFITCYSRFDDVILAIASSLPRKRYFLQFQRSSAHIVRQKLPKTVSTIDTIHRKSLPLRVYKMTAGKINLEVGVIHQTLKIAFTLLLFARVRCLFFKTVQHLYNVNSFALWLAIALDQSRF